MAQKCNLACNVSVTDIMIQYDNCLKYFNDKILTEIKGVSDCWIAGGCMRDYFSIGYCTSDIDIYFSSQGEYQKCLDFFTKEINGAKPKGRLLFENEAVVKISYKKLKLDIIKKVFISPEECIKNFDFTVCAAATDGVKVYVNENFFMDLAKKQLNIIALPFPLSTMWRAQKYFHKGYRMCKGETLKLAMAISELEVHKKKEQKPVTDTVKTKEQEDQEKYDEASLMFLGID